MKQLFTTVILITLVVFSKAQIPSGYYNTATGTGAVLKTQLYNIIKGHTQVSYTPGVWNAFYTTDKKANGKVWDMYSDVPGGTLPYEYTLGSDQCGSYSAESDCYNREHSFPKSWFGDVAPMNVDLFHLYPTDGYVNGKRSNYPYGTVSSPTWISLNGSKLGPCSAAGYTGIVFEPRNEYKGDFARTYFYMVTRYENVVVSWNANPEAQPTLNGTTHPCFDPWILNVLLAWNASDPVSAKETARNNAVYAIQNNRNPYIDHPEYVNSVWGTNTGIKDELAVAVLQVYPNPVSQACTITLPGEFSQQNSTFTVYSSTGMQVNVPLSIAGDQAFADLGHLPAGFYMLQLSLNDYKTIYRARIIKK